MAVEDIGRAEPQLLPGSLGDQRQDGIGDERVPEPKPS
jgi:hypothetical protein